MDTIREFYKKANIMPLLLKQKMAKFSKHNDIAAEFEYWIQNGKYKADNPVAVEGYTAESLSKLSKYLDGEGAFILLVELRDNPSKAKARITEGFKME